MIIMMAMMKMTMPFMLMRMMAVMMKTKRIPGVEERESLAFPPRSHLPLATWSHNESESLKV